MRKLFVIAFLLSLAYACTKEDKNLDSAIITGLDPRDCMCLAVDKCSSRNGDAEV